MKKETMSLVLCAALIASMAACTKPNDDTKVESAKPAETASASAAPITSEQPVQQKSFSFVNGLEARSVAKLFISSSEEQDWNEPINTETIAQDGEIPFDAASISWIEGGKYDIGVVDEIGVNYDIYDVELKAGDQIALVGSEIDATYNIVHEDGSMDILPAVVTKNAEPVEQSINTVSIGEKKDFDFALYTGTDTLAASYTFSNVFLSLEDENNYPMLASAIGASNAERRKVAEDEFEKLVETLQAGYDASSTDENAWTERYLTDKSFIRRSDSKLISVLYERTVSNGTERETVYSADCFNTESGARLMLSDVVGDISVIPSLLNEQLEKRNEDGFTFDADKDYVKAFSEISDDFAWTLETDGITFFFNENAFGIEDAHSCSVKLLSADHPELIKKEYASNRENYTCEFGSGSPIYVNLGGAITPVSISGEMNENDMYEKITVYVGENSIDAEFYGFNFEPIFVHADNRDYLYVRGIEMDDYRFLHAFEITDGLIRNLGHVDSSWHYELRDKDSEDFEYVEIKMIDPKAFLLDTYTDIMGTSDGCRSFKLDENGLPVTDDVYYVMDGSVKLTVLREIELELVDEAGDKIGGTVKLEKGEVVEYLRTDNIGIADLLLNDGRIVRIEIEMTDEGPTTVGESLFNIFDGIIYAG